MELRGLVLIALITAVGYLLFTPTYGDWTLLSCMHDAPEVHLCREEVAGRTVLVAGLSAAAMFWALMWFRSERRG